MRSFPFRIPSEDDVELHLPFASAGPDQPAVESETIADEETSIQTPWRVILYNDDVHTFDEVIQQLIMAIRCSHSKAEALAWEVHTRGKAMVFEGDFEECFRVQSILRQIELITELRG